MSDESESPRLKIREIDTLKGKITELVFDEPTGREVRKIGMPFRIISGDALNDAGIDVNTNKVGSYIEKCCGLGVGDADKLRLSEFVEAQNIVMGFFGKSES